MSKKRFEELETEHSNKDGASNEGDNIDENRKDEEKTSKLNQASGETEWTLETKLQSFLNWCDTNDLKLSPKVTVKYEGTSHRYGMVATCDISKGEVLFVVPRNMILNADNSLLSNRVIDFSCWLEEETDKSLDESSGWVPLLLTLLYEFSKKQSFWDPYLRLIPTSSEFGHPLFWTEKEQINNLKGLGLLLDVARDIKMMEYEYKEYVLPFVYRNADIFKSASMYSLELYKRMVAFVMSYSFTEDDAPAMVPMADILNHHSNNNAHLLFGTNCLKMISLRKIEKGEEIYNTFGKLGNSELLQMYGYVEPSGNQYDAVTITMYSLMEYIEKSGKISKPYLQAMFAFLDKTKIAPSDEFFLFDKNGLRYGPDLLQMLKVLHMSELEFENVLLQRAGNRKDSFYKKLWRKVKVEKKTILSSGVAIIDITEEETETEIQETEMEKVEESQKRKIIEVEDNDADENKNEDESNKRACLHDCLDHHCNSLQDQAPLINLLTTQHGRQRHPDQNTHSPTDGHTKSDAIVIDDDDDLDHKPCPTNMETTCSNHVNHKESLNEHCTGNMADQPNNVNENNTVAGNESKTIVGQVTAACNMDAVTRLLPSERGNSEAMTPTDVLRLIEKNSSDLLDEQIEGKGTVFEGKANIDSAFTSLPFNTISLVSPTKNDAIAENKNQVEKSGNSCETDDNVDELPADSKPAHAVSDSLENNSNNSFDIQNINQLLTITEDTIKVMLPNTDTSSESSSVIEAEGKSSKCLDKEVVVAETDSFNCLRANNSNTSPVTIEDEKASWKASDYFTDEKPRTIEKQTLNFSLEDATAAEKIFLNCTDTSPKNVSKKGIETLALEAAASKIDTREAENKKNAPLHTDAVVAEHENVKVARLADGEDSGDDGDVEFVSEDIGCIYTYELLNLSLPKEHKETLIGLIKSQMIAVNNEGNLDQANDVNSDIMSSNEKNSFIIRCGQYEIFKKCLDSLS